MNQRMSLFGLVAAMSLVSVGLSPAPARSNRARFAPLRPIDADSVAIEQNAEPLSRRAARRARGRARAGRPASQGSS